MFICSNVLYVIFSVETGKAAARSGNNAFVTAFGILRIIVTAGGKLPINFLEDLKYNGILVIPVEINNHNEYIIKIIKTKINNKRVVKSITQLHKLFDFLIKNKKNKMSITFQNKYSLTIIIDIPVRFVPLRST